MDFPREIEHGLDGAYRKSLWRPFMSAIKEYALLGEGDRIAVCLSGGKDSMLLAKLMQNLRRHSPVPFDLRFLCMDPGYTPEIRAAIEANCALLGIPVEFFETDIFDAIDQMDCNMCFMCARMRRGYLYRRARAMGCNKIALGHHFDDVVETTLLNLLYGGRIGTMLPAVESENVPGMSLIRPMYKIREADILRWRDENQLVFPGCACRRGTRGTDSRRAEMKRLVGQLDGMNPDASRNIFRSLHDVHADAVIGFTPPSGKGGD